MITEFFESRFRILQLRGGQDGQLLDVFAEELRQSGFAQITARRHIRAAEHLLYWAKRKSISPATFDEHTLDEFTHHHAAARATAPPTGGICRRVLVCLSAVFAALSYCRGRPPKKLSKTRRSWCCSGTGCTSIGGHVTRLFTSTVCISVRCLGP